VAVPQIYLIVNEEGDWSVSVYRDVEALRTSRPEILKLWAILHVGFARQSAVVIDKWFSGSPQRLMGTAAAKYSLIPNINFGRAVVRGESDGDLFTVVRAWDEAAEDEPEIQSEPVSKENEPEKHDPRLIDDGDELRRRLARLTERALQTPIDALGLSVRAQHVLDAQAFRRIGDLAVLRARDLMKLPNMGWKSVVNLFAALDKLAGLPPEAVTPINSVAFDRLLNRAASEKTQVPTEQDQPLPTTSRTLGEIIFDWLSSMSESHREMIRRRSGLGGKAQTLEEVGFAFNVTRERIRQIESQKVKALKVELRGHGVDLSSALANILGDRKSPVYLDTLGSERAFFSGPDLPRDAWRFLLDRVCEGALHILKLPSGPEVISRIPQEEWEELLRQARQLVASMAKRGGRISDARILVEGLVASKGTELAEDIWQEATLKAHLSVDASGEEIIVGYGQSMEETVRAILTKSERPLHYSEIAEVVRTTYRSDAGDRFVHSSASRVAMLLGRGVFGLDRHLTVSNSQKEWIKNEAARVMATADASRQWHAQELYEEVAHDCDFSDQFDHYVLNEILRSSDKAEYLGRHVWTIRGARRLSTKDRIDFRNVVEAVLVNAGRALSSSEIYEEVEKVRGLSSVAQLHPDSLLVRLGPGRWGLRPRDFPMNDTQLEVALRKLRQLNDQLRKGIHVTEIPLVMGAPFVRSEQQAWALMGLAASTGQFRVSRGNYVFPADWDSPRRKSIAEAVRDLVNTTGAISEKDAMSAASRETGLTISPSDVRSALRSAGATRNPNSGAWMRTEAAQDSEIE
jgi:hypothetical protein